MDDLIQWVIYRPENLRHFTVKKNWVKEIELDAQEAERGIILDATSGSVTRSSCTKFTCSAPDPIGLIW